MSRQSRSLVPELLYFFIIRLRRRVFLVFTNKERIIKIAINKIKKPETKNEAPAPVVEAPRQPLKLEDIKDDDMMAAALVATIDYHEETHESLFNVVSFIEHYVPDENEIWKFNEEPVELLDKESQESFYIIGEFDVPIEED